MHLPALSDLAQARRLSFHEVTQVGEDVRVLARLASATGGAVGSDGADGSGAR